MWSPHWQKHGELPARPGTDDEARDLGPRGITAVVVDPGPTDTDMNPAEGPAADFLRGFIALGHDGHARDVAGMVACPAGPGGRHVTGNSILVDGGFAA